MLHCLNNSWWNKPCWSLNFHLVGDAAALPALHHLAMWAHRSTPGKCLLPGLTGQPQSQPRMLLPTDSSDRWTGGLDTPLCLCEKKACSACVQLPLRSGYRNNPPHSVASSVLPCLPCLFCSLLRAISPLGNATTSSWEGRRGRFRCCPTAHECQAIISWWLCSFLPRPFLWCYLLASCSFFLWGIVNITASQSLALSKVPRCIIHEFGNKRSLFRIPLSLMNFHRWISGLFGWLKLKFELLKLQGGALELLCQEGWGRQHFIFSLIRTSL